MDDYVSFVLEISLKTGLYGIKSVRFSRLVKILTMRAGAENISENSCAERCMRIAIPGMKSCTIF